MEAADKRKTKCTKVIPIVVPMLPQAAGVKTVEETGKEKLTRNAGNVVKRATEKANSRRSVLIWTNLDPARLVWKTGKARTT